MSITANEVRHIALLSRLALTDEEVAVFQEHLDQILGYVDQLKSVDTTGIDPTFYPLPLENVFREDEVETPLDQSEALRNSADATEQFFVVPKVADGSS